MASTINGQDQEDHTNQDQNTNQEYTQDPHNRMTTDDLTDAQERAPARAFAQIVLPHSNPRQHGTPAAAVQHTAEMTAASVTGSAPTTSGTSATTTMTTSAKDATGSDSSNPNPPIPDPTGGQHIQVAQLAAMLAQMQ